MHNSQDQKRDSAHLFEAGISAGLMIQALEQTHDAIFIAAPSGEILYANRSALEMYEHAPQKLLGSNVKGLVAKCDRGLLEVAWEQMQREDYWEGEMALMRRNGRKILVRVAIAAQRDERGQPQSLVISCFNLNEQRLLEESLRQAQKLEAVGLLASGLAHNINSPLAAIIVTAEMAQAKYPQVREFQDIMQAADRIQEIVANLMTKSRQEQSTEEMDIDLNQLVKTELKFLEANLFFKHQVELEVNLEPKLPRIQGLYSDFSQCFYNLVQNALDAMQEVEERKLIVKTGFLEGEGSIYLSIRDTGCGIAQEHLKRIFEPFFTTKPENHEDSEQLRPSGTGLGLSTSQQLMDKYCASVEVSSQIERGSEFRITIPLQVQEDCRKKRKSGSRKNHLLRR